MAWAFTAAALAVGLEGCDRSSPVDTPPAANGSSPGMRAAIPIDHLGTGELLEGPEHAFGLALPRGIRIDSAFASAVYASGPGLLHPIVQYFRTRLQGGDLREGESSATFEHVKVPGDAERELRVHVASAALTAHIEVVDTTPPPAPDLPDEKARWRQVGLTPDGHLADPNHLD